MEEDNAEVIKGLAIALASTITSLLHKYQQTRMPESEQDEPRAKQLFNKFMKLLSAYHTKERSLQFYADKMCLTPKYVSGAIKSFSGKGPLDWINEYVVLEAEMMLRYTKMSVQGIAYALNFPTQSAFGEYFKQQTGMSPREYRYKM